MEKGQLIDKRRHPRRNAALPVLFKILNSTREIAQLAAQESRALSKDLSRSGLALASSHPLKKGDMIKLKLEMPGMDRAIRAFAEVVWSAEGVGPAQETLAGIRFLALRQEDEDLLDGFVAGAS